MNLVATKQVALDNSLVAPEKRLKIKKCNARITFSKPEREEPYQVSLDALKLTPCYPAFLITIEVHQIYMHQFWNTIKKIRNSDAYNFKLDKKKCQVDTEELGYSGKCISGKTTGLDRLRESQAQILWGTLKFVSKTKDSSKYGALIPDGMINQDIKDSKACKTYYDFSTGKVAPKITRKFKKIASPSRKMSPVKEAEPVKKSKRVKRPAKKSTDVPTTSVVIRDTPALLEYAQIKKALEKSRQETHKLQASGSSGGADFE
ncbi:hypothetical protein Tco_1020258 [Tanacetum coccineum]|uniref:Uncharacterized protein n=1 Tax=Tanacetum coccineum TaxID=301880 RepID=A0ABQ5G0V5_9ASTR